MFSVFSGTEEVCHMQQCLLADYSTAEHRQWQRFGLQRLHTATACGRPVDVSVMVVEIVGKC